jgi:hypothetical protein
MRFTKQKRIWGLSDGEVFMSLSATTRIQGYIEADGSAGIAVVIK